MIQINYSIEFLGYWHAGSGLSGGVDANTSVIKDELGLPFIPGRTIKGLLREAAEVLNQLPAGHPQDFLKLVFGEEEGASAQGNGGICFFSNAELSAYLKKKLGGEQREKMKLRANLYQSLASTAIDEKGQAIDQSLRQMEVTIPLTLYGTIGAFPKGKKYQEALENCFSWTRRLGMNRNRGLGRCIFTLQT